MGIFAGSNTTGEASKALGRKWIAVESELEYVIGSAFRFMPDWADADVAEFIPPLLEPGKRRDQFVAAEGVVLARLRPSARNMQPTAVGIATAY